MIPQAFLATFSAFGLSAAAGFNGWATLFIVALIARLGGLELATPFDIMATDAVVIGLGIIMLIEGLADKVPGFDHASHLLHLIIQPAAGAILFAAQSNLITDISPIIAFFVGALIAGSIHGIRTTARTVVTVGTAGMGNTAISFLEDATAILITIASILAPVLMLIGLITVGLLSKQWWQQRRVKEW